MVRPPDSNLKLQTRPATLPRFERCAHPPAPPACAGTSLLQGLVQRPEQTGVGFFFFATMAAMPTRSFPLLVGCFRVGWLSMLLLPAGPRAETVKEESVLLCVPLCV